MKSIGEFERLYKINIPLHSEFDYYFHTLLKSAEHSHLIEARKNFESLESILGNKKDIKKYKEEKMDEVLFFIKNSQTYYNFMQYDIQTLQKPVTEDARNENFFQDQTDRSYISIDMVSANYSTMKNFGEIGENEICKSWKALMENLNVHPAIANSKSFRQLIFGNLSPNRNQRIQQSYINFIVERLKEALPEKNFPIYITHDEVIIPIFENNLPAHTFKAVDIKYIKEIVNSTLEEKMIPNIPFRFHEYEIEKIGERRKIHIERHLDENRNLKYRSLFGVPGHQHYFYFKKYILHEEIIEKDLYFWNDDKLAMWVIDKDKSPSEKNIIEVTNDKLVNSKANVA